MSETGHNSYHERAANGNSHIVVLIKNFHFVLITAFHAPSSLCAAIGMGISNL
jgi:hypothetical protein